MIVDDSVFSLFTPVAWLVRGGEGHVAVIFPRPGVAETWTVRDQGLVSTTLGAGSTETRLRLISVESPRLGSIRVWMDAAGRLAKVEIPRLHMSAERQTGR